MQAISRFRGIGNYVKLTYSIVIVRDFSGLSSFLGT